MNLALVPSVERALAARQAYFEQGRTPAELLDDAIFRSWARCSAAARSELDRVEFEPVGRAMLRNLLDRNHALLHAARGPLDHLAQAVAGAGYAVLLADPRGHALSVGGAIESRPPSMRMAFREGVDLTEDSIGTSAMSCALNERRAVRVFGPEHFFSAIRGFHCAAAPVIAPDGQLAGVVDITRESPVPDPGALALVSQCAQAIERGLLRALPACVTLALRWQAAPEAGEPALLLAFGGDGEIIGLTDAARRFIGSEALRGTVRFEDLFDSRFGDCIAAMQRSPQAIALRLRSGVRLFAASADVPLARNARLLAPLAHLPATLPATRSAPEFGDPAIAAQLEAAHRALSKGLPLLVLGETGTGKEVVAQTLHARSSHGGGTLVALNCAAIPESLIEGELFGHVEGAYTGARRGGLPGKIEQADGGTLFLDEIGDMPLHLQARLLRVLETREVSRLGSTASRKVDFQLVCATHQDIALAIREGRFRADLYYRINGFALKLAPLRNRSRLGALIDSVLAGIGDGTRVLTPEARAMLLAHTWPGNTRELKHALSFADAMAEPDDALSPSHFPTHLPEATSARYPEMPAGKGLLVSLQEDAITHALQESRGNVRLAAQMLGISRATLYRRLKDRAAPPLSSARPPAD
ncbi:MAG: sigma-54-dependent Fis family transcriptional regulator [Thauera sp.]|nr:sigma-54-dependent Fis family transcriptional regulator [Thauera sp.]